MRSIIDYPNFDNGCFEIFMSGSERPVSKSQRNCSMMSNKKEMPRISFQWVYHITKFHCTKVFRLRICNGKSISRRQNVPSIKHGEFRFGKTITTTLSYSPKTLSLL